jgi:glutathione S-transferase
VLELWQAEWCPYSHKVRQRLTELGLDYVCRQVAADQDDRDALEAATGYREIPALVSADCGRREVLSGADQIIPWLDRLYDEREDAARHRARAQAEVRQFDEVAELVTG